MTAGPDASARSALGSVRDLEQALAASAAAQAEADAVVESARGEAARLVAAARERARETAAERRRMQLRAAADDVTATEAAATARVDQLRRSTRAIQGELVETALALILPPVEGSGG